MSLSAVLMVKNEEQRLPLTLESIRPFIDNLVIYDTGSSDNTIEIVRKFSKDNDIPLYLKEGKFEDFATSRNVLLDFADEVIREGYLLLLDSNDELRGGERLREFLKDASEDAYYLTHIWKNEVVEHYFKNINLLRAGSSQYRYTGVVHEYLSCVSEPNRLVTDPNLEVYIFQDRVPDLVKSKQRYHRDLELLRREYAMNRTPRTIFYLARTYRVLADQAPNIEEKLKLLRSAVEHFKERSRIGDYWEEVYHSCYACGELSADWEDKRKWYMKAWELGHRVEPLMRMAEHYRQKKDIWSLYMMCKTSMILPYPTQHKLFVNRVDYEYTRYHLMGLIGFYVGDFEAGKEGAGRALAYSLKHKLPADEAKKAIDIYIKRDTLKGSGMSREEYIEMRVAGNGVEKEVAEQEWAEYRL